MKEKLLSVEGNSETTWGSFLAWHESSWPPLSSWPFFLITVNNSQFSKESKNIHSLVSLHRVLSWIRKYSLPYALPPSFHLIRPKIAAVILTLPLLTPHSRPPAILGPPPPVPVALTQTSTITPLLTLDQPGQWECSHDHLPSLPVSHQRGRQDASACSQMWRLQWSHCELYISMKRALFPGSSFWFLDSRPWPSAKHSSWNTGFSSRSLSQPFPQKWMFTIPYLRT